jgi:hypothetical protein
MFFLTRPRGEPTGGRDVRSPHTRSVRYESRHSPKRLELSMATKICDIDFHRSPTTVGAVCYVSQTRIDPGSLRYV